MNEIVMDVKTLSSAAEITRPPAETQTISIVVPAKDEEESLSLLVEQILSVVQENDLHLQDIVLVDDGSGDNSWQVMCQLAERHAVVKALRLRRNFGKATGLMVGIEVASGDIIFTMDADLQDDPKEIPNFLAKLNEGYDLVSGWKKVRHDPASKTLPSRLFNWVTSRMSGVSLHDFNNGFKAYRREIFNSVQLYGELHRYVPVLAHALGYKIGEIPVRHHPRLYGRSKYGVARFLRGFLDLLTVMMITRYAYRPGHLFGGIGTFFSMGGTGILGYLSILKLFTGASIGDRPLLILGVMMVIIGVQLLLFGMLAELIINRTPGTVRTVDLIVGWTKAAE